MYQLLCKQVENDDALLEVGDLLFDFVNLKQDRSMDLNTFIGLSSKFHDQLVKRRHVLDDKTRMILFIRNASGDRGLQTSILEYVVRKKRDKTHLSIQDVFSYARNLSRERQHLFESNRQAKQDSKPKDFGKKVESEGRKALKVRAFCCFNCGGNHRYPKECPYLTSPCKSCNPNTDGHLASSCALIKAKQDKYFADKARRDGGTSDSESTGKCRQIAYCDSGAMPSYFKSIHRRYVNEIIPVRKPLQTAGDQVLVATEEGIFRGANIQVGIVPKLDSSLISVGALCDAGNVFIGNSNDMVFIKNNEIISDKLQTIIIDAHRDNLITLQATRPSLGLYEIDLDNLVPTDRKSTVSTTFTNSTAFKAEHRSFAVPKLLFTLAVTMMFLIKSSWCHANFLRKHNLGIQSTQSDFLFTPAILQKFREISSFSKLPTHTMIDRHGDVYFRPDYSKMSLGEARHIRFQSTKDLVEFYHELLGHINMESLIKLVEKGGIENMHPDLTVKAIRQYYPYKCKQCGQGSMAQKPVSKNRNNHKLLPTTVGSIVEVDILYGTRNGIGQQLFGETFSAYKYLLVSVDHASRFIVGKLLKSMEGPELANGIQSIIDRYRSDGHIIKHFKFDDQFDISDVHSVLKANISNDSQMTFETCPPHEHSLLGLVERTNRSIEESIIKAMSGPNISDKRLWGLAAEDSILKLNLKPRSVLNWQNPYEIYFKKKFDLSQHPLIPFGSKVLAHVPAKDQTVFGAKSFETLAVGSADNTLDAIKLWNPATKKVITRRTYKEYIEPSNPVFRSLDSIDNNINLSSTSNSADNSLSNPTLSAQQPFRSIIRTRSMLQEPIGKANLITEDINPNNIDIPKSIAEAEASIHKTSWMAALKSEIESLIEQGTWENEFIGHLTPRNKAIPSMFVFDVRYNPDGSIKISLNFVSSLGEIGNPRAHIRKPTPILLLPNQLILFYR